MKKIVILSFLALSLFASDEYIPVSELSHSKKQEYNFVNKTNINKAVEAENNTKVLQESDEVIEPLENVEIKERKIEENIDNSISIEKIENKKEEKEILNKELVKEYKNDNILQDTKTNKSSIKDFTITPKFTYSYITIDGYYPGKVGLLDKKNVLIPEILIAYNNHMLKAETMSTKAYFKSVLIDGGDLDAKTSSYKLSYLYKYQNANFGLAYNYYKTSWDFILYDYYYQFEDKQIYPSLELHMKNEENRLQVEYGLSYGKNSDIDYAYEYYINLGYKIFNNDGLIASVGYKNKTIDIDSLKFEYKGPTISLSGKF
jgi:hypothetical protein